MCVWDVRVRAWHTNRGAWPGNQLLTRAVSSLQIIVLLGRRGHAICGVTFFSEAVDAFCLYSVL